METYGVHPRLDTTTIALDEPNLAQIRQDRMDRNWATMQAVDTQIAATVMPKTDNRTKEEKAAVKVQSFFRGHLGRKEYTTRLLKQFEQEEAMRLEKTMKQVEEGELLVENHRLEVQIDDNSTTRRNKSRQYVTHVITIQRAWRSFKLRQRHNGNNNNMSPLLLEAEELSETESSNGAQAMSLSTPEDSEKNLKSEDQSDSEKNLKSEDDIQSDFDSTANVESEYDLVQSGSVSIASSVHSSPRKRIIIEPEPESVVSDYSEMADSIKEHLANVQIIQKEDLEAGNTMCPNQFSIQQKIVRGPEESEEDFAKRLRKVNYLSLAQEFAELKKINADALPFGLHKKYQDYSPMSDVSTDTDSSERYLSESATGSNAETPAVTPMENAKDFVPGSSENISVTDNAERTEASVDDNDNVDSITTRFQNASSLVPMEAWIEALSGAERQNQPSDHLAKTPNSSSVNGTNTPDSHRLAPVANSRSTEQCSSTLDAGRQGISQAHIAADKSPGSLDISPCHTGSGISTLPHKQNEDCALSHNMARSRKSVLRDSDSEEGAPDNESREIVSKKDIARKKTDMAVGSTGEGVGDFDVYNIETTLPQMDWALLEEHLQRAAEEERQKSQSRRNDREEIRRKLAMGGDEDYYGGERMFKKPNLQTRLQGGMNLQICFVNEATSDVESINGDGDDLTRSPRSSPSTVPLAEPKQIQPPPRKQSLPLEKQKDGSSHQGEEEDDLDFFSKQAKLQAEATMALAQVPAMAHMQLEVEKQMRKKSPINEIVRVGIPGFADGKRRKLNMKILGQMNLAQIQLVVNDLKGQIESLNEELVRLLLERDDLHMEQDSKLVDIEDLTRHAMAPGGPLNQKSMAHAKKAKEFAAKVNVRQAAQKKKERTARK